MIKRRLLLMALTSAALVTVGGTPGVLADTANKAGEVRLTESQMKLIELATQRVETGAVSPKLELNGEITPNQDRVVEILPRAPGIVREVKGRLGDVVRRGQTLAVVESSAIADAQASFLNAQSKAKLAQIQAAAKTSLWRKQITSRQDYLVATQAAAAAAVDLRAAEGKLALFGVDPKSVARSTTGTPVRFPVTAPFDGTIIQRTIAPGDQVTDVPPATPLFRLANLANVWVMASVFQKDMGLVAIGQRATVSIAGYQGKRFPGKVTWISDVLDQKTRTLQLRIELANINGMLRPGSFATVELSTRSQGPALTIPEEAVQHEKKETIVFVDAGSGLFKSRKVKLGASADRKVEVLNGLKPGEKVVTQGAFTLLSELDKDSFANND